MNHLFVSAVLHHNAVKSLSHGRAVINFTVCNTEDEDRERGLRQREVWFDCVWHRPQMDMLDTLVRGALVYLEGRVYQRRTHRTKDNTPLQTLALEVTECRVVPWKNPIAPRTSGDETL